MTSSPHAEEGEEETESAASLDFEAFVHVDGRRLQHALLAAHGPDLGADIYADVMAKAWADWARIGRMDNAAGYLWQVARSEARRYIRWNRSQGLPGRSGELQVRFAGSDVLLSLGVLSDRERVAVVMVHVHRSTYREVAELLDVPVTTVTNLVHRGLRKLRREFTDRG